MLNKKYTSRRLTIYLALQDLNHIPQAITYDVALRRLCGTIQRAILLSEATVNPSIGRRERKRDKR